MNQPIVPHDLLPPQALADRVPFHLSPDGQWLAITVQELRSDRPTGERLRHPDGVPADLAGSHVVLVETTTGEAREPFPRGSISWAPQWSPDGHPLAAYVRHEGPACLAIWEAASGAVRFLREAQVRTVYGFEGPQWLLGSQHVVAKLHPADPAGHEETGASGAAENAARVLALSFDPAAAEAQAGTPEHASPAHRSQGDLALVDTASGKIRRLARGWSFDSFRVAPDGHAIAVLRSIVHPQNPLASCYDLVTIAVETGEVQRLAARVVQGYGYLFNWSPDSRQIAYFHAEAGQPIHMFAVAAGGAGAPRRLSGDEDLRLPPLDEYYQAPRWSADSRFVYVLSGAIWTISADGSARRPITPDLGGRRLLSWVQPAPSTPALRTLDSGAILALTRDPTTKKEGLARIDLETGESELLAEWEHVYGMDSHFQTEVAPDGSAAYLASQAAGQPPRVWRISSGFRIRQALLSLRPDVEDVPPENRRLIEYRTVGSGGEKRQAILWLPPDYQQGQRLPLIGDLYPGVRVSTFLHGAEPGRFLGLLNRQGYAILKPDVLVHGPDLLRQLAGEVVPAINHLVDQGMADPQRIGLFGHSRGGHAALGLITQTDLFRAAVVSAAQVTLTSCASPADFSACETGIYACGGTLWEQREAYIENSPLFYLDRVRTPLLVIAGTASAEEEQQARQTFGALCRLGQRVELRLYRDEDHDPAAWTEPTYRDAAERIVAWFDAYVKGER